MGLPALKEEEGDREASEAVGVTEAGEGEVEAISDEANEEADTYEDNFAGDDEWVDPSEGGILGQVMELVENGPDQDIASLLSQLSVSVDTPGEDGDSALHLACLYGRKQCVDQLLAANASAIAIDEDGGTPLHDAAAGGYVDIMEGLFVAGAEACVNRQDNDGETPLHLAARGEYQEAVQLLLCKGADPAVRNQAGKTPAQEGRGSAAVLQLLRAAVQAKIEAAMTEAASM